MLHCTYLMIDEKKKGNDVDKKYSSITNIFVLGRDEKKKTTTSNIR